LSKGGIGEKEGCFDPFGKKPEPIQLPTYAREGGGNTREKRRWKREKRRREYSSQCTFTVTEKKEERKPSGLWPEKKNVSAQTSWGASILRNVQPSMRCAVTQGKKFCVDCSRREGNPKQKKKGGE